MPAKFTLRPTFRSLVLLIFVMWVFFLSGCNMPTGQSTNQGAVQATQAELDTRATIMAQQLIEQAQATGAAAEATRMSQEIQSTLLAQQSTQLAAQAETQMAAAAVVEAALPSQTVPPATQPPTPAPSLEAPTQLPATPTPDIDTQINSAKILLYEDMAGLYEVRYIKNALDMLGLSYVDVGDAAGNFKTQILSGTDWDLIIVGAEARTIIQGEFFVYLNSELNRNTAVIIEIWALDEIASGTISNILTRCGIKFQKDWVDPEFPSLWYLVPEHPVFHEPNEGMSLTRFIDYWSGDEGDLIQILPGGDATLLVGNIATEKQRYGTVAVCEEGRLIIQTHSSHNYRQEDMTRLWQNYIYHTLKNHLLSSN